MTDEPKVMKYDDGKLKAGILFEDFPLALKELIAVCTYGDLKYKRSSWKGVPDKEVRYKDAKARHIVEAEIHDLDDESLLYHLAHEAWNCLALLQLKLQGVDKRDYKASFENARKAKALQVEKEKMEYYRQTQENFVGNQMYFDQTGVKIVGQ